MGTLLLNYIINTFSKVTKLSFVTTVFLALILPNNALANNKEKSIYHLQAELIYNFLDHIEWIEQKTPIKRICIIGDNPVTQYINPLVKDKDSIIVVRKYENDYLGDCHILFVNNVYQGYVKRLLLRVKNKSILTIGDKDNFIEDGGDIQFILRNNRIKLSINKEFLTSSSIRISNNIVAISNIIENN